MRFWKGLIGFLSLGAFAKDYSSQKLDTELNKMLYPNQLLLQSQEQLDMALLGEQWRELAKDTRENIIRSEAEAEKTREISETEKENDFSVLDKYIFRECILEMFSEIDRTKAPVETISETYLPACFKIFCTKDKIANAKNSEEPALPECQQAVFDRGGIG